MRLYFFGKIIEEVFMLKTKAKTKAKRNTLTFEVDSDLRKKLKILCAEREISIKSLLNEAVEYYLKNYKDYDKEGKY
jgi:hypothetical protein